MPDITSNLLYKYTPYKEADYRDDIVVKSFLRFSKIDAFNDPLDSRLDYRLDYSEEEIINFWRHHCKSSLVIQCPDRCPHYNAEFVNEMKKLTQQFRDGMGVLSMSNNPGNILMWSHYANNHRGIVYGFNPVDLFPDDPKLKPVEVDYMPNNTYELLDFTLTGADAKKQYESALLTKANDWSYEEEFRYIDLNFSGNKQFNKNALKVIIFGALTTEAVIKNIRNLCEEHELRHVKLKQAEFEKGSFNIKFRCLQGM